MSRWLNELIDAAGRGDQLRLSELLQAAPERLGEPLADEDCELTPGSTLLHLAVRIESIALLQELILCGADLEVRNAAGRTVLHDAIEVGFEEGVELLLESGASIDVCSAAMLGLEDDLIRLVAAEPDVVNDRTTGLSPLGWAAFGNQPESARILLERGARMDDGELLCAAAAGHVEVGRVLLDFGADPNAFDERAGGTALHSAVGMKFTTDSTEFIRLLLSAGADPSIKTSSGLTAPELASFLATRQERSVEDHHGEEFQRAYCSVLKLFRNSIES